MIAGLIGLLGLLMLSSCSSNTSKVRPQTPEDIHTKEMTPSPGKSLVYLYYGRTMLGRGAAVSLDEMTSTIEKDTYVVWEVSPGKHDLQFILKKLMSEEVVKKKISCEPNNIYYFRLYNETDTSYEYDITVYSLRETSQSAGQDAIREFRLMAWYRDGAAVFQRGLETPKEKQAEQPQVSETLPEKEDVSTETTQPEATAKTASENAETPAETTQPEQPAETAAAPIATPESLSGQGRYYALVIGISDYATLEPLPTAVKDAQAVAAILQETYGMQVNTLLNQNATREQILEAIEVFQRLLVPADKLLIYYAGHGQLDADTQAASWLPVNATLDSLSQWIPTETITASLRRLPANQILVVADSAYSGTLARAKQADLFNAATRPRYLESLSEKVSRVVITSGALHPVAANGNAELSLFAAAFVGSLQRMSQPAFAAEELFVGALQEQIAGQSDQLPEFQVIRNSGHAGGDFLFTRR